MILKKWTALSERKNILPILIIYFSKSIIHKEMEKEFEMLENSSDKIVKKEFLNHYFEIEADLYTEVLKIVEMVVPY